MTAHDPSCALAELRWHLLTAGDKASKPHLMSWQRRMTVTLGLYHYIGPLVIVYAAEYAMQVQQTSASSRLTLTPCFLFNDCTNAVDNAEVVAGESDTGGYMGCDWVSNLRC